MQGSVFKGQLIPFLLLRNAQGQFGVGIVGDIDDEQSVLQI